VRSHIVLRRSVARAFPVILLHTTDVCVCLTALAAVFLHFLHLFAVLLNLRKHRRPIHSWSDSVSFVWLWATTRRCGD